jgi:tetratricopeptide (TPR) repeat protein
LARRLPLLFVFAFTLAASRGPDEHLFAGARDFRDGRFAEALVEFRVADKLSPGGEAAWYSAACLVRLNRAEDAVEAFGEAERRAPSMRDDLFDYYRAVACHEARLYLCADRLLAGIGVRAGPRIRDEALRLRQRIEPVLSGEPASTAIDWYYRRAQESANRPLLAAAYLAEARGLTARRAGGYRTSEERAR